MSPRTRAFAFSSNLSALVLSALFLTPTGCDSKPKPPQPAPSTSDQQPPPAAATPAVLETVDAGAAQQRTALALPTHFGHVTGDWGEITKRGFLRVLVIYSKSGFF